ncbi:NUDIX domain-containing protein [Halobacillus fulvus]|nr:NUDIX domain-containing protein [Halobacillus fulvus]
MTPIQKAYGYIVRYQNGKPQVLVFEHPVKEAGIQIPKGTVEVGETPRKAVIREMMEETGLVNLEVEELLADDLWRNDGGLLHHRFFYRIKSTEQQDQWFHAPSGGGKEDGLIFRLF